jgi:subtilisin family serine protease
VFDTGLAANAYRPGFVRDVLARGQDDRLDETPRDRLLDFCSGHGTFVAGVVHRFSPHSLVHLNQVLDTSGAGDDAVIADALDALTGCFTPWTVVNLSLGAPTEDDRPPLALSTAVRKAQHHGAVVVASAGNDTSCRVRFPAGISEVVSVGAVGPGGPAWFTNYGTWVRACAPGVDVESSFLVARQGGPPIVEDEEKLRGFASWSGTSFAAPVVSAAISRTARQLGVTAAEAVRRVVDDPTLYRLPLLGALVSGY